MAFWDPPVVEEPVGERKPHKTVTGRVVYARPWHNFTLKDATRILKKMYISYDDWEVGIKFFDAVQNVLYKLASRLLEIAYWGGEWYILTMKQTFKRIIRSLLDVINSISGKTEAQQKALDACYTALNGI